MRRISHFAAVIAGSLPVLVAPAAAAPLFTSRSGSTALVANCPSGPLGGVCNPNYVLGSNDFTGYVGVENYNPNKPGFSSASYAILKPTPTSLSHGSAIAFALTDPASDLPVLKAGAFTRPTDLGRYTTSYAFMSTLAAYTYTGTEALPLSLVGNLDYLVSFAPINYPAPFVSGSLPYSFAQLRARLVIGSEDLYQGTALQPNSLVCGATGVLASAGGFNGVGGYATGAVSQSLTMTLDASNACAGGGPVMIQPGENFYVYAFLETLAIQGGTVNATNSFYVNFTPDTPQSVIEAFATGANPVGVPEPASWAMLIAGFGLTGAMLRRRRVLSNPA
jgi:hypothetical protein